MFLLSACLTLFLVAVLVWPPLQSLFRLSGVVKFGRLTYGMYVFHNLSIFFGLYVVKRLFSLEDARELWFVKAGLGLAITWSVASLSWSYLEKPLLALKGRYTRIDSSSIDKGKLGPIAPLLKIVEKA